MRKTKKEKKEYTAFYLETSIKERIQKIVDNPNTMFDSESGFYRHAVKRTLPEIEKEIKENEE